MEAAHVEHGGNDSGSRQNEASQISCSDRYYGFIMVVAELYSRARSRKWRRRTQVVGDSGDVGCAWVRRRLAE